jgi:hypothetical protein
MRTANQTIGQYWGAVDDRHTPCACKRGPAVVEKAGRSVCRACADSLTGQEFPLRGGRWRRGLGEHDLRQQLSMLPGSPVGRA